MAHASIAPTLAAGGVQNAERSGRRGRLFTRLHPLTIAWSLLLALGALYLIAPLMDIAADLSKGIAGDHAAAFQRLTGASWATAEQASPGVAHYITRLEIGYAIHELVFGLLFLAIVAVPFRQRARWAWWACWAVLIANVAYSLTFGPYSATVLYRSLIADIALPALLLVHLPAFFGRRGDANA